MNIAIITPGILPTPSTKGGAVEALIDTYIEENEVSKKHFFLIYSVYDKDAYEKSKQYKKAQYIYIKNNIINKLKRQWFKFRNQHFYYNYHLDFFCKAAIDDIKTRKVDLIVFENRPGFVWQTSKKQREIPFILHLHNDTLYPQVPFANEIVNNCKKIITVSDYIKKRVESINGATSKVQTIYNGIDLSIFNQTNAPLPRKELGFAPNDFIVVYTGRISPIKGIKELLESFKLLLPYPEIKLLIIGKMEEDTKGDFIEQFNSLTSELKKKISIKGYIPNHKLPQILGACNIGIIPSICEDALTLSSIENMAIGLPLIVTKSGGIPEAVSKECAIIVEKDDLSLLPKRIADSILKLYHNRQLLPEMSKAGIERSKMFDKKLYAQKVLNEFFIE